MTQSWIGTGSYTTTTPTNTRTFVVVVQFVPVRHRCLRGGDPLKPLHRSTLVGVVGQGFTPVRSFQLIGGEIMLQFQHLHSVIQLYRSNMTIRQNFATHKNSPNIKISQQTQKFLNKHKLPTMRHPLTPYKSCVRHAARAVACFNRAYSPCAFPSFCFCCALRLWYSSCFQFSKFIRAVPGK